MLLHIRTQRLRDSAHHARRSHHANFYRIGNDVGKHGIYLGLYQIIVDGLRTRYLKRILRCNGSNYCLRI